MAMGRRKNICRSLVNVVLKLFAAYEIEFQSYLKESSPGLKRKSLYMCFSGKRRIEETTYKTWVGQLILIVVSLNYSAISGNYPLAHHRLPLCKMGRVIENLNLGTWSPSTATPGTCLLTNTQLCLAGVTHSASSQEPGGLITCSFRDLWTLLGRGLFKFNVVLSHSWGIHFAEIREEEHRDWSVLQRKLRGRFSIQYGLRKCFVVWEKAQHISAQVICLPERKHWDYMLI